ncbi:toxin glutamine deamidase domain-containing protein [Blastococcus sp. SYSU DS1021]
MSELQVLCDALTALNRDIASMAQELHGKALAYNRAATNAAAVARAAEGPGAVALLRTTEALAAAARHCAQAAASLAAAGREGQAYVQRTVGATAGGAAGPGGPDTGGAGGGETGSAARGVMSVDEIRAWLPQINPGFTGDPFDPRSSNCGSCAAAVFAKLSGGATKAAALDTLSTQEMESVTGRKQIGLSPAEIEQRLIQAGPGAHAVVGVDRQFGPGHWFNAYYDGHQVLAIDGQSNTVGKWPPDYGSASCPVVYWDAGV